MGDRTTGNNHEWDCGWQFEQYAHECTCGRSEAERRVIAVRGSWDVPGFEACVRAELAEMRANGWSNRPKGGLTP